MKPDSDRGRRGLALLALLISSCAVVANAAGAGPGPSPAGTAAAGQRAGMEPKAVEILKASCARLAAARTLAFTAVTSYESPTARGPSLVYTTRSSVILQRPDKLRVLTPADGPATEFYYDGKSMYAFAPAENLLATVDAPATIDAALAEAFNGADIYFAFSDLIVADPWQDLGPDLKFAFYIGQSKVVGDTVTDMVAYGNDGIFVQAWIGADDKLPRRLRAVYLDDPLRLRHDLVLSGWQLNPALAPDSFAPKDEIRKKAKPIQFDRPDVRPGTKPGPQQPSKEP